MPKKPNTGNREVKLKRRTEEVDRDSAGEVVGKTIYYYEYVYKGDLDESKVIEKYQDKLKLVRTEKWEVKDGQLQKTA